MAAANNIQFHRTVFGTDFVSAGVGGMRNVGSGTIALSGVSGTITKAYLYWSGPTNSTNANANANVMVNGQAVVGTNIGFSSDNNWGFLNSQAYRADVTSIVQSTGNGNYNLTGFGSATTAGGANTNGASLLVFFNDTNNSNNRDIVLFDGNDSNINNAFDAPGWNVTLSGITYTSGMASLQLHVVDGQAFLDDALVVNDTTLVPAGPIFQGTSVPSANNGPQNDGSLWDIRTFDVTSRLSPGNNTLTLTTGVNNDALGLVVAIVNLPAGAAPDTEAPMATTRFFKAANGNTAIEFTITDNRSLKTIKATGSNIKLVKNGTTTVNVTLSSTPFTILNAAPGATSSRVFCVEVINRSLQASIQVVADDHAGNIGDPWCCFPDREAGAPVTLTGSLLPTETKLWCTNYDTTNIECTIGGKSFTIKSHPSKQGWQGDIFWCRPSGTPVCIDTERFCPAGATGWIPATVRVTGRPGTGCVLLFCEPES
jgi:hypothetical protein